MKKKNRKVSNIKIKELTPSLSLKVRGIKETIQNLKAVGDLSKKEIKKLIKKMNNQDIHLFVALEGNDVVGILSVIVEQKLIREGALAGHIEDVATRKGQEGKGIGSMLMKHAIDYSKERGCYKIILDCGESLQLYYNKFEFKTSGVFMRRYILI